MAVAIYPDLKGKTALVTGGGSGIGESLVRAFIEQGMRVAFIDFNAEASTKLAQALGSAVAFEQADLRDIEAATKAVERLRGKLGPFDILVNNAARDDRHKIEEVTLQYWRERMATNLDHQFFVSQAVYKDMIAKGGGSIINMSSSSFLASAESFSVYKTAKSAVIGLTRSFARELGAHNIRVNCILPGWIMTSRQRELWVTPEAEKATLARQCIKRLLVPDDIANMVLFLASDASSAITAQSYMVDGGQY